MEPKIRLRTVLPWIAALVLIAVIAGVAVWNLKPRKSRQVTRFYYELPKDQQSGAFHERGIAVSPDGRQFVYGTNEGLYLRSTDTMDARLLPGTGGEEQRPFFSQDGKLIVFFSSADKKLRKISISGGAPVTLEEVRSIGSFDSNMDDTIVYGQEGKGILRVSAGGGTPEVIVKAVNETIAHPQILPDGKSVLFTRLSPPPSRVMV